MRIVRSMQAIGPIVEIIAAIGVGMALFYVYLENLPAAKFIALISGIFILYDPIKTFSRIHMMMQRSVQATMEIFRILDSTPTVLDRPDAMLCRARTARSSSIDVTFRYEGGVDGRHQRDQPADRAR